jgi:hypothetical protein
MRTFGGMASGAKLFKLKLLITPNNYCFVTCARLLAMSFSRQLFMVNKFQ